MKNKRTILSLFLILLYVHSFAHGSLPHNNCNDHQSSGKFHHDHESLIADDDETHCTSSGIIHSFVHLIESLAHNQFAHDGPIMFESNGSKVLFLDQVFVPSFPERSCINFVEFGFIAIFIRQAAFFILHSPLRGPPLSE